MPPEGKLDQIAHSVMGAARRAGVGRSTIYEEISQERLRAVKRGRRTLILAHDLRRWLASLPPMKSNAA